MKCQRCHKDCSPEEIFYCPYCRLWLCLMHYLPHIKPLSRCSKGRAEEKEFTDGRATGAPAAD